jgi:NAD(P)-dependent dehydrogenase (short-subunit alcohol dehydrogenase family)
MARDVVVTGFSSGIGLASCNHLAQAGRTVIGVMELFVSGLSAGDAASLAMSNKPQSLPDDGDPRRMVLRARRIQQLLRGGIEAGCDHQGISAQRAGAFSAV